MATTSTDFGQDLVARREFRRKHFEQLILSYAPVAEPVSAPAKPDQTQEVARMRETIAQIQKENLAKVEIINDLVNFISPEPEASDAKEPVWDPFQLPPLISID